MSITIISYNRPLTRSAKSDLEQYGIIEERNPREAGRQSVIEVEERPPRSLLEKHELRIDENPDFVYETDNGSKVKIYPDRVINDGVEATLSPEEAKEIAEEKDWNRIE